LSLAKQGSNTDIELLRNICNWRWRYEHLDNW